MYGVLDLDHIYSRYRANPSKLDEAAPKKCELAVDIWFAISQEIVAGTDMYSSRKLSNKKIL